MDRRSILAISVLIFLVCSSSILVKAQDQEPDVVAGQDPTQAQLPQTSNMGSTEINLDNDDTGFDAVNRDFYEAQESGPEIFVAGH
ncbi:unnamed protein product [Withania somnifera]